MDEYINLEEQICNEIREWSKFALEKPNKNYNNLPSCPFAKKAWVDKKVAFAFNEKQNYQIVHTLIENFNDNKDLIIVVDLMYEENDKWWNGYETKEDAWRWHGYEKNEKRW
jgi:hypothetical protein